MVECRRSSEDIFYITYRGAAAGEPQVFLASTRADVVDVVGQIYRHHPPGAVPLEFYVRGLEQDEATALLRSLEIDSPPNQRAMLSVRATGEVDTLNLTRKLRTKYDFAGAKLEEVRVEAMQGGHEVTLRVNVNAIDVAKPPLRLQIRFWIEGILGEETVAKLQRTNQPICAVRALSFGGQG